MTSVASFEFSDQELLRDYIKNKSETAFTLLLKTHSQLVFSSACRRLNGNKALAEEVAQAVFCALSLNPGKALKADCLSAWLHQVTRYTALNLIREIKSRKEHEETASRKRAELLEKDVGLAKAEEDELKSLLDESLDKLSSSHRTALVMHFLHGYSKKETAQILKCAESTIHERIERGLDKLRILFQKKGIAITGSALSLFLSTKLIEASVASSLTAGTILGTTQGALMPGKSLTLAKGAMKAMFWAKAKLAAVATLALILTGVGSFVTVDYVMAESMDKKDLIEKKEKPAKTEKLKIKKNVKWKPPYKNNSTVVKKLKALGFNQSLRLSKPKVLGLTGAWVKSDYFKYGPFTRDYGTKMPYASDRKTAFYCGQGHNDPHFNDAWEYHLGSNTWHCLSVPDGGATGKYWRTLWVKVYGRNGRGIEKDEAKRKEMEKKIKTWAKENLVLKDGYVQTSKNAFPIFQWHTWDGLTYDPITGQMHWAHLGGKSQDANLKKYCKILGKDYAKEKKKTKPYMGMISFDPGTKKWVARFKKGIMPEMRGMGGSLTYIPDQKKVIWYVAASNVVPADFAMWSWDIEKDIWKELRPNDGKSIRDLVIKKIAPAEELQMAYSEKHKTLVSVQGKYVFTYNIKKNEWKRVAESKVVHAHDAHTVFDYDSLNDVFILVQPKYSHATYGPVKYHQHKKGLFAFSLDTMKWEELTPKGAGMFKKPKYEALKGYYDPEHNVFVISAQGIWVYRYSKGKK